MNMKESKSDDEMILEATVECREANEVEKREKEMSFASDTVEKPMDKNVRNCERMSDKSEANKFDNHEISMRKVCKSIDEVKNEDSTQKNKRKTRKNDGELDDYDDEMKICDDDNNESDKWMNLDDETIDLNDSFLDSGQVDNEEEDGASETRGEVEETIKNGIHTKETDFEVEKHENEEKSKFGRECWENQLG